MISGEIIDIPSGFLPAVAPRLGISAGSTSLFAGAADTEVAAIAKEIKTADSFILT